MVNGLTKRALGVLVLAVLANVGAASAQGVGNWSDTLFSEKGHDFGPVPRGAKGRHPFVLTNRTAEPLTIVDVRASCGCTSGRADKSLVQPGQTAVVEAEMDTRNFVGVKATTLYVTVATASGGTVEVGLRVQSNILSDIVLNPGTIDFGTVVQGQPIERSLTIDRVGEPGWRAERMLTGSRSLQGSLTETVRNGGQVGYLLKVAVKPDAPAGPIREEIRILTNDRSSGGIPVLVTGFVRGKLTVTPSVLAMGVASSAAPMTGKVVVRGAGPFAVKGVDGASDGFSLTVDNPDRKPVHVLTITYKPEEGTSKGDLSHTFRLQTDQPGDAPVEVLATLHVDP